MSNRIRVARWEQCTYGKAGKIQEKSKISQLAVIMIAAVSRTDSRYAALADGPHPQANKHYSEVSVEGGEVNSL